MKIIYTRYLSVIICLFCFSLSLKAQNKTIYSVTGGEWIVSFADIKQDGAEVEDVVRFSPVFNFTELVNFDPHKNVGFFTGLAVRNVGFIYDVPNSNIRKKIRSYNVGLPVAIKVGNMNGIFLYGGYEFEMPFSYKEKTFTNDEKTGKFTKWFSDRTPTFTSAVFAGVQLPHGASIKFKYYLDNFFDKDYTENDEAGNPVKPYENMDVNVFYVSVNVFVLKNAYFYHSKKASSPEARK